jgi:RND family efflux transporter MFP subunit
VERGARVKKGELLIKLNTDVTEKSIEEVQTNLELVSLLYEKQKELWEQNIGSELQYLEAKNAMESIEARLATLEKQLEMANITAPFSGIVEDIIVKEGEIASPGMQLLRLINLSVMRISARVSEAYISNVHSGSLVQIRVDAYPDLKISAQISRLGEVIDQQTRTFTLEVELDNQGEKLKPNMLTSVRIQDYEDKNALVVPSIILKQDFNGTFLFCVSEAEGSSKARKVYVESGITVQDITRIESGLGPKDLVITKGYNLVGDGTPVRIVNL